MDNNQPIPVNEIPENPVQLNESIPTPEVPEQSPVQPATIPAAEAIPYANGEPIPAAATPPVPKKKKKTGKIILTILGAVILLAAIVAAGIYIVLPKIRANAEQKRTSEEIARAKDLVMLEEYLPAIDILKEIDGENAEAMALLKNAYKSYEKNITDTMESGDYIEALELAKGCPDMPNYSSILNQIEFESYLLACAQENKKSMYDPDSLKINDALFYIRELDDEMQFYVLLSYSGKTRNGNTNLAYEVFQYDEEEKGMVVVGVPFYDLDADEIDDDELLQKISLYVWDAVKEEGTRIDSEADFSRVKRILSNDVSLKLDLTLFDRAYVSKEAA